MLTVTTAATALDFAAGVAVGVTGFEKLVLGNFVNTVTLNTAIEATATNDGNWSTITGGSDYDTVVFDATGTQDINTATVTGIERFQTSAVGDAITFVGQVSGQYVDDAGGTGATIVLDNFVNTLLVTGDVASVTGGTSVDTVTFTTAVAAAATTVTGVENVTLLNGTGGGADLTVAGTGSIAITANMGATITLANTNKSDAITLGTGTKAGADTIVLAASNTVANLSTVDTITGFAFGTDQVDSGTTGASFFSVSLTSTTLATFAGDVTAALDANATYAAAKTGATLAAGDVYMVTITGGSLAGTYLISDTVGGDGVTTDDFIVKVVGTSGVASAADFA